MVYPNTISAGRLLLGWFPISVFYKSMDPLYRRPSHHRPICTVDTRPRWGPFCEKRACTVWRLFLTWPHCGPLPCGNYFGLVACGSFVTRWIHRKLFPKCTTIQSPAPYSNNWLPNSGPSISQSLQEDKQIKSNHHHRRHRRRHHHHHQ